MIVTSSTNWGKKSEYKISLSTPILKNGKKIVYVGGTMESLIRQTDMCMRENGWIIMEIAMKYLLIVWSPRQVWGILKKTSRQRGRNVKMKLI